MRIVAQSKLRIFLIQQNYSGVHPMVVMLPQLIRNDGLYETYLYLKKRRYEAIFHAIDRFIENEFGNDVLELFVKKGLDQSQYMEITKNIMNLASEWIDYKLPHSIEILKSVGSEQEEEKIQTPQIYQSISKSKEIIAYQEFIKEFCLKKGYLLDSICAKGIGKLVIGIGDASVQEVSMTLHPFYRIPYIPSSAIKGVFHHYCSKHNVKLKREFEDWEQEWFGGVKDESKESEKEGVERGNVIYTDIYIESGIIMGDVLTPHYKKYYGEEGKCFLEEKEDTKPVTFKSVQDAVCNFSFIFKKQTKSQKVFIEYFKKSFSEVAFGAKSSSGYGYFKEVNR